MNGQSPQLLFVDDEEQILRYLSQGLGPSGYEVVTSLDWAGARRLLSESTVQPEIIFIEPLSSAGDDSLAEICSEAQEIPVVVLSASREPKDIVHAMRSGAHDYLCKPVAVQQLDQQITRILGSERETSTEVSPAPRPIEEFVFSHPEMKQIGRMIEQISETKVPVLLQGESGVGKEVVARWVHQQSALSGKPFVKVNCAAMPSELVESELFGYRKGAFTGAHVDRPGKFEFASGGTIFLDEIGEFTSTIQAKLLQVLQEGRFMRLGSNRETQVDVRVIAATNRRLEEGIKQGTFREDLYYRLNVVNITVPPLRQRREEIPLLASHFMDKLGPQYNATAVELPEKLEKLFLSYHWPGNVRELENLIKRFLVLQDEDALVAELEAKVSPNVESEVHEIAETFLQKLDGPLDLKTVSRQAAGLAEKNMILKTLRRSNWNRAKTARQLKISYKTLLTKIHQHGIRARE